MPSAVVAIGRPDFREIVVSQLGAEGIVVRAECGDAAELLATCEIEQPDVVVLGDGISRWNPSVLAQLRTLPVTLLALVGDEAAEQSFRQAGVSTLWVFDVLAQPSLIAAALLTASLDHAVAPDSQAVVVVTGPAGSTGKTTGALILASLLSSRLVDGDPRASIHLWRGDVTAPASTSVGEVLAEIEKYRTRSRVVVDAGGDPAPQLLRAATHVVLVATCDPIGIARLMDMLPAVARPGRSLTVVLNQARGSLGHPESLLGWLARIDPTCQVVMVGHRRRVFDRALRSGEPERILRNRHLKRRWSQVATAVSQPSMPGDMPTAWKYGMSQERR